MFYRIFRCVEIYTYSKLLLKHATLLFQKIGKIKIKSVEIISRIDLALSNIPSSMFFSVSFNTRGLINVRSAVCQLENRVETWIENHSSSEHRHCSRYEKRRK